MRNSEILNFISTREILLFYKKFNDLFMERNLINNKEKTLDLFSSYIYRDWVSGIDDKRLEEFLSKYDKCIVKPLEGSGGYGIEIVDTDLIKDGNYSVEGKLIEALIIQHDEINKLYPYAVNTLRVFRWVLSIPFFISCIRQQNPLTVLSKIILRKVKQFNLPPPKKNEGFLHF
ncbi:ATP-grasp domain-containing protein [Butyricimonas faecalis]|uniref:hypothetical protein n=1 Tax=Butyricimonas faecalis TaxID=2093856 RepID=UPI000D0ACF79|nr:hypothetical protein [Butyricimonas faecalis]